MSIVTEKIFARTLCAGCDTLDEQTKAAMKEMNIPIEPQSAVDAGFYDLPEICFYCGERFAGFPAIMWQGYQPDHGKGRLQVWLHVECAKALCLRLMRDWDEAKTGKEAADQRFRIARADHQTEQ